MDALWTAAEAAQAVAGTLAGCPDWTACGVSIDSRSLQPGDLFVALRGDTHDGHNHVAAALAAGAAAALVSQRPDGLPQDAPLLLAEDTAAALTALARAARARSPAKIVAVTGSVGKTGSKEMLALALGTAGKTYATVGNLNNHWGVPLSLARLPADAAYAVFELGMNHPGEITPLTRLVRPHVALITTVEAVHLEFFASTAAIADAKAEIFLGLEPGGVAVLPRDNPQYHRLRDAARAAGVRDCRSFGSHIDAQARMLDCAVEADHTLAYGLFDTLTLSWRVGVAGRQWGMNSLGVLLAAEACGVLPTSAAPALTRLPPVRGRGQQRILPWPGGAVTLIDESYNASPVSMRATLQTLGGQHPQTGGRRIAILGDMRELGPSAADLHRSLLQCIIDNRIDLVFTAGPLMLHLHNALPPALRGGHAETSAALTGLVSSQLRAGDVVVVKGSAGSKMGVIVQALSDGGAMADATPVQPH